jgi:hypothetical protein
MSDPNSNTAAGASGAEAASGTDENPNLLSPSDGGSGPETGVPLANDVSDVAAVLGPDALNEFTVVSTVQPIEDTDLHSAVVSTTDAALFNVDYTLDQLINSTDLFDVPALDFSDDSPT